METIAQVAVEAIINNPEAYNGSTIVEVLKQAEKIGVSEFYLQPLRIIRAQYA